jgi:hypothetical protein
MFACLPPIPRHVEVRGTHHVNPTLIESLACRDDGPAHLHQSEFRRQEARPCTAHTTTGTLFNRPRSKSLSIVCAPHAEAGCQFGDPRVYVAGQFSQMAGGNGDCCPIAQRELGNQQKEQKRRHDLPQPNSTL